MTSGSSIKRHIRQNHLINQISSAPTSFSSTPNACGLILWMIQLLRWVMWREVWLQFFFFFHAFLDVLALSKRWGANNFVSVVLGSLVLNFLSMGLTSRPWRRSCKRHGYLAEINCKKIVGPLWPWRQNIKTIQLKLNISKALSAPYFLKETYSCLE